MGRNMKTTVRGDQSKRKLTSAQIEALLAEQEVARNGKRRVPNGWRAAKAAELGVSVGLIEKVLSGELV